MRPIEPVQAIKATAIMTPITIAASLEEAIARIASKAKTTNN